MSAFAARNTWIFSTRPRPEARMRLFCFPHAGGGASSFSSWAGCFPAEIEVCPVQLPGRENRMREAAFQTYAQLIPALAQALTPAFDLPFAFFGHSMGALISVGLTQHLRQQGRALPLHLFASAYRAPQLSNPDVPIHALSEPDLIRRLRGLNGTPAEILDNPELRAMWLPLVRADFAVCETYQHTLAEPFSLPITALGGWQDSRVTRAMLENWQALTSGRFQLQMLPGAHFYLHNVSKERVIQLVTQELRTLQLAETQRVLESARVGDHSKSFEKWGER